MFFDDTNERTEQAAALRAYADALLTGEIETVLIIATGPHCDTSFRLCRSSEANTFENDLQILGLLDLFKTIMNQAWFDALIPNTERNDDDESNDDEEDDS